MKAKKIVATVHEKISNVREDFLIKYNLMRKAAKLAADGARWLDGL